MIEGSIVAIVTPMDESGEIDYPVFNNLLEWHIECGTDAVVVVGTTGESATLSVEEHCQLVKYGVEVIGGRIPVIAGTGSNSTAEALFFTDSAKTHGADACLLVTPYYNKPSQEGLFQHFKTIAEAIDIPQILYNVPGRTACDLPPETVERLADIPTVVGIKEATGDVSRGIQLVSSCGDRLSVYSGDDPIALSLMLGGARGNISVTANVTPGTMHQMCKAAIEGNEAEASRLDQIMAPLHKILFIESNPVPVKWALYRMGLIGKGIRLPLVELNAKYRDKVEEALSAAEVVLTS
jgi:4-hydroxy-tetrahydrodipicolinate synthase